MTIESRIRFIDCPSPNFGPRREGKKVSMLILHYTDTADDFEALRLMQDPQHQASAHYMINKQGHISRLVPEELRAWHAGKSHWAGEEDINSVSIGVEIENPGHTLGYVAFPEVQISAAALLCKDIIKRYEIPACHVLGHSDIAPLRKSDPGEFFPWNKLAAEGVGIWPDDGAIDKTGAQEMVSNQEEIKSLLKRYGYDTRVEFEKLITAFQRHFEPELFETPAKVGKPTVKTVLSLKALVQQKLLLRPKWPNM